MEREERLTRSKAFRNKYLSLSPTLASHFYDSDNAFDDEALARSIDDDRPVEDRIEVLRELLADAHKLMANLEEDWEIMAEKANRRIHDLPAAREWLMRVVVAWQEELNRLQNGGSKIA